MPSIRRHRFVSLKAAKLLLKIKRHILAHPDTYRQDEWHCGTAACIAGHAALLSGLADSVAIDLDGAARPVRNGRILNEDWEDLGYEALGRRASNSSLFSGSPVFSWPEPFNTDWKQANTRKARAQVAARRIDYFIRTGE